MSSDQKDDALYLSMLEQMGLKSNQVPQDMRETLYTKLGIKAPGAKVAAQKREKVKKDSKK